MQALEKCAMKTSHVHNGFCYKSDRELYSRINYDEFQFRLLFLYSYTVIQKIFM